MLAAFRRLRSFVLGRRGKVGIFAILCSLNLIGYGAKADDLVCSDSHGVDHECIDRQNHIEKIIRFDPDLVKLDKQVSQEFSRDMEGTFGDERKILRISQYFWMVYIETFSDPLFEDSVSYRPFLRFEYQRRVAALYDPHALSIAHARTPFICPLDAKLVAHPIHWKSAGTFSVFGGGSGTKSETIVDLPEWGGKRPVVRYDIPVEPRHSALSDLEIGDLGNQRFDEDRKVRIWWLKPWSPEMSGDDRELVLTDKGPYFVVSIYDPNRSADNGYPGRVFLKLVNSGVVAVCAISAPIILGKSNIVDLPPMPFDER